MVGLEVIKPWPGGEAFFIYFRTGRNHAGLPNKDESAKYLGIWGVASFIGAALGPMVGGPLLHFCGKTDKEGAYSLTGCVLNPSHYVQIAYRLHV